MKTRLFSCVLALSAIAWSGDGDVPPSASSRTATSSYVLGPNDIIQIQARDADEIALHPYTIDNSGEIRIPVAGRMKAGGLTLEQFETALETRLRTFIREPDVVVRVVEMRSQPVSVIGAVKNPGMVQIQGNRNLVEVLSLAGGLREDCGPTLRLTRKEEYGAIPLPNVRKDLNSGLSVANISVKALMEGGDAAINLTVMPQDVISVPRAELVYVLGEVHKAGGFPIREGEQMSALMALSLAEGQVPTASLKNARILRNKGDGTERTEMPVNLRDILLGKAPDVRMQPNDVLVVPNSLARNATVRTIESAIQIGTGIIIWRR